MDDRHVEKGAEVITETGKRLGWVCKLDFEPKSHQPSSIWIAASHLPFLPGGLVSVYKLPADEIVTIGCDRLIVFEGAEERLQCSTVGVLERLGIAKPPWKRSTGLGYVISTRTDRGDEAGGSASSPVPRQPTPTPLLDESTAPD